jgi:hypothetical protein
MPENEYLELFEKNHGPDWASALAHGWHPPAGKSRTDLVLKYALAVPTQEALDVLARHAPLIEIGAGGGYWAYLLRKQGVDILPFDVNPPREHNNSFRLGSEPLEWVHILQGGPSKIKEHPERTLFLCWPPTDNMALSCLKYYKGDVLIYVGEPNGGCTANDAFYEKLLKQFHRVGGVRLPQWQGVKDALSVWKRRETKRADPKRNL